MTVANELKIVLTADDRASGGLSKVKGTLQGIGKVALGAVAGGIGIAGAAIGAVAAKGIADFIGFETQMNEVFTLLPGISGQAMDTMSRQVLDAANQMGRLPEEVVPALYQSLSAGVPTDNVFEFIDTAHKAALGGVTDLETAVDGISSVVNAYGSEVVSAADASDIMFTAVRLGKTDFGQLSSSLFNVIPTAASLGVSFGDVAASLATLTGQGTPTSVATTQIRGALVEASKGGTKLDKAIQELTGFTFPELIQQGESMPGIFESLRSSMPEQEFKDLFGSVEAVNAVLGITGPNFDKTSAAMAEMAASSGATDAAFETMNSGIGRTLDMLKARASTTFIKIGSALAPLVEMVGEKLFDALDKVMPIVDRVIGALSGFFDNIAGGMSPIEALKNLISNLMINVFGESIDTAFEFQDAFDGIVAKIRNVINIGREFITSVFEFLQPVIEAVTNFVSWKDILIALGVAIASVVIPAIISIATTLAPIIAVIVGVVALVAILRTAWENNFLGIRDIVANVIGFIRNFIESALTFIQEFWAANGEQIKATAAAIWDAIQLAIQTVITTIQTVIQTVMTAIQEFWAEHGEAILLKANEVWNAIQLAIETVIGIIETVVAAFREAFEGNWREFGEKLREAWDDAWEAIQSAVETIGAAISEFIAGLIESIVTFFTEKDWPQIGKDLIQGIANGISSAAGLIRDAALAAAGAAWEAVKGFFGIESPSKLMFGAGENVGAGLVGGILSSIGDVENAMGALLEPATLQLSGVGAGQGANTNNVTNNEFNLHVLTTDSADAVISSFDMLRSMVAGT